MPLVIWVAFFRRSSSYVPFNYPLGPPTGNLTFSPTPERQIPPYLHYVYGLSPTFGGKPFAFIQYLCLTSALKILKPEVIYFHYVFEPQGWYWEQWQKGVRESGTTRLEMIKERDVTSIHGNHVEHFAHKADVLRLEALRDYGGIYLDMDVLVIKGQFSASVRRSLPTLTNRALSDRLWPSLSARARDGNGVAA